MWEEKRMTDPYFSDVPWEQFYDENGRLIGEYFIPLPVVEKRGRTYDQNHN